jgi:hypothetical protein
MTKKKKEEVVPAREFHKIHADDYKALDGLDLAKVEELSFGPNGYQTEPGFEIVENDPRGLPVMAMVPVFVVLCKSKKHPEPQYRYVSPYELRRERLEVADRLVCVRLDVAGDPLSEIVVGRTDDVLEEARSNAVGHGKHMLRGLGLGALRRIQGLGLGLPGLIKKGLGTLFG